MQHAFKLGGEEYDVGLSRARQGYRLHVGGKSIPANLVPGEEGDWVLNTDGAVDHILVATHGDEIYIHLDGESYHLQFEHTLQRLTQLGEVATVDAIRAAMPGSLISLDVAEGDHVQQGQTLLVMESMKMETTIVAPRDGVVLTLHVGAGETFDKDAPLVTLEPEAAAEAAE